MRQKHSRRSWFLAACILASLATVGAGCNSRNKGSSGGQSPEEKKLIAAEAELKQGEFLRAQQMLTPPVSPAAAYFVTLSQLDLVEKPDFKLLSILTFEKRGIVLEYLALFMPQTALDYLHTRGKLEPAEVQAAVIALKMQNQTPEEIAKQGEAWIYSTSKYEKDVLASTSPNLKEPEAKLKEDIRVFIANTQRLRRELTSAIAALAPKDQLRVLEEDRALEKRAGAFMRDLPLPAGPAKVKLPEYKKGMARIAQEYFDRDQEIAAMENSIKTIQASDHLPSLPEMKEWPWLSAFVSGQGAFSAVEKTFDEKNYLGTLILIDLLRSEILKADSDYYTLRAGLLLMQASKSTDSVPLRRFVYEELVRAKQDAIIQQWQKLVH